MLKRALLNNIHIYDVCGMDYVLKLFYLLFNILIINIDRIDFIKVIKYFKN